MQLPNIENAKQSMHELFGAAPLSIATPRPYALEEDTVIDQGTADDARKAQWLKQQGTGATQPIEQHLAQFGSNDW
jgi:hypothetical protein